MFVHETIIESSLASHTALLMPLISDHRLCSAQLCDLVELQKAGICKKQTSTFIAVTIDFCSYGIMVAFLQPKYALYSYRFIKTNNEIFPLLLHFTLL